MLILPDSLHVFGFLGGKEVKEAGVGNLGLHDRKFEPLATPEKADAISAERTALRWVNKFIPAFGGDPSKVTM